MKHRFFIITSMLAAHLIMAQNNEHSSIPLLLKVFESKEFSLTPVQLETVKTLLNALDHASPETLTAAARIAHDDLDQQIADIQKTIESDRKQGKPIPLATWRTMNLLIEQKEHLKEFTRLHQPTFFETLATWFGRLLSWDRSKSRKEHQQAQELADLIVDFIKIERENILFSYPATLAYLSAQNIEHQQLPEIIEFWDEPEHQYRLLYDVKRMAPEVQVQQAFLIDLIVQTVIMSGASIYEGWVSKADAEYYAKVADQERKMQDNFNIFEKDLAIQQEESIKNLMGQFSQNVINLSEQRKKSDELFTNEVIYLNKLFDDAPPKDRYVIDPLTFDQVFAIAPMYTPAGYTWYNVYPQPNNILVVAARSKPVTSVTDWEYESSRDQFYQFNLVPFQASKEIQDAVAKTIPPDYLPDIGQYAHNNNIFCEYVTGAASYEITIDLTIIGASYPFFAGIMFNKARWISGVVEHIENYRLVGLYGTTDEQGTKKVILGFAENKHIPTPPGTGTGTGTGAEPKPTIVTPLQQITHPQYQPLLKLDPSLVADIGKNSTTFTITILTQPTVATISVSATDSQGNKRTLVRETSITNLDPLIYLYHGIGFMAPGCQAGFKIIQPAALTYTQEQRTAFDQMMAAELKQKKPEC